MVRRGVPFEDRLGGVEVEAAAGYSSAGMVFREDFCSVNGLSRA